MQKLKTLFIPRSRPLRQSLRPSLRWSLRRPVVGLAATAVSGAALADIPSDALTALTNAGTDATTVGWAAFGVLVAVSAFKYIRKAL